jgi:uncharacterized protein YgiM (DUF1202 family)
MVMKHADHSMVIRKLTAWGLCLFIILGVLAPIYAAEVQAPVSFSLNWLRSDGSQREAVAEPVAYPGFENSYWLYIDEEALGADAALNLIDLLGQYPGGFALLEASSLESGTPLSALPYQDAGNALGDMYLTILALGVQGETLAEYRLYFSISAIEPEPPQAEEPPAVGVVDVPVLYLDISGQPVAEQTWASCQPNAVTPVTAPMTIGEYTLVGDMAQNVTVDADGVPSHQEVVFTYQKAVQAVTIPVYCYDEFNQLIGDHQYTVTVSPGASEIVSAREIDGYTLADGMPHEVTVTVDADGIPSAEQVTFMYRKVVEAVTIPVYCYDEFNQLIGDHQYTVTVSPGASEIVSAREIDGYTLVDGMPHEVTVTVSADGILSAEQVTFMYRKASVPQADQLLLGLQDQDDTEASDVPDVPGEPDAPVAQPIPIIDNDPINRWAVVTASSVNFREGSSKNTDILVKLLRDDMLFIHYQETHSDGPWYKAIAKGRDGYVMAEFVRLLDEEESAAYNATLASPAPTVLPVETEIPEPTTEPILEPTTEPTAKPTLEPTTEPTAKPTLEPTTEPTAKPTLEPTTEPTAEPTTEPTTEPTIEPTQEPMETPVISSPIDITVLYVDEAGHEVAQRQVVQCVDGTNSVEAKPIGLKEGYTLTGDPIQYVIVKNNVADVQSITFVYTRAVAKATEVPAPAPKVKIVYVYYRDQSDNTLFTESVSCYQNENNIIFADPSKVPGNKDGRYTLNDVPQKSVLVDNAGNANPAEVIFRFADTWVNLETKVKVHFRTAEGETLAPSKEEAVVLGVNDVYARPDALPNGYTLVMAQPQKVTMAQDGSLSPAEVIFIYQRTETVVTASPTPAEITYSLDPMDAYAYPRSDAINFRSSPFITGDNVLSVVSRNDLAHITGSLVNEQDELWYYADINGTKGFIKESVVRILTEHEVAALMGYTPSPEPEPTAQPTAIPDGEPIDLWGEVLKGSVRFRSAPAKARGNIVLTLNKGDKVWVYTQKTEDGEPWYHAKANNKDGYVMAELVRLYLLEESEKYQLQLATPMPTQEPPATTVPEATPEATDAPTQEPEATEVAMPADTLLPYQGYALTTQQVALRSGSSEEDDTILETLPAETLLYLWGQTQVGDVVWNSVEALAIARSGFVPDSALRRISGEEAEYHRSLFQPVQTASPEPSPPPQVETGYAITLGDNVPLRRHYDTYAEIDSLLDGSIIVSVLGQEYTQDMTWHLVQYGERYGFIRADQLRMLNEAETAGYLESLKTPLPTMPPVTFPPVSQDSPSSYGYVNADNVRLRKEPSTDSPVNKMMNKNAFALVLGSVRQPDGIWYHINQSGTEGYVLESYFTVLPLNQLTSYLKSSDYLGANTSAAALPGSAPAQITSVEDFNTGVWKNPALAQASYEPFVPPGTSTPLIEAIETPAASGEPTEYPLPSFVPTASEMPDRAKSSSFPVGLLAVGIVAVLGGGGYYAYYMYRDNQKRAAQRAAQQRQQAQQAGRQAGQPSTRPAARQPGYTSPYMPPQPRPPAQGPGTPPPATGPYRPPQQPGSVMGPPQPGAPKTGTAPHTQLVPPNATRGLQGSVQTPYFRPVQPQQMPEAKPSIPGQPAAPGQPVDHGTRRYPAQGTEQGSAAAPKPPGDDPARPARRRRTDRHQDT